MKGLFSWIGSSNEGTQATEVQLQSSVTPEDVGKFLKYFPIGTRVQYYPEFSENIRFDTFILAYAIDETLVFANSSISFSRAEGESKLLITTESGEQRTSNFESFHFLVPRVTRSEIHYSGTAEDASVQRPVNDFTRGNTITLINKMRNGKVSRIDTAVTRSAVLTEGCYAKRHAAYLQPSPETFEMCDKREFSRIYTNIPASLTEAPESEARSCMIIDYSEGYLRVDLAHGDPLWTKISKGNQIFVSFDLPHKSEAILMQATAMRIQGDQIVLKLTSILRGKQFKDLDFIDKLELKASFLEHPATPKPSSSESC
jgi:hypothetical protein